MQKGTQFKYCFIIAPISVNTEPLKNLLAERKIQVKDALSLPSRPGSALGEIDSAIRAADFVCAFIAPQASSNINFEIGLAYGVRKPIFLVVDKEAALPFSLEEVFYVRAPFSDIDAIKYNLDHFLEHPAKGSTKGRQTPTKKKKLPPPPEREIHKRLESIRQQEGLQLAIEVEEFLTDFLTFMGAVVIRDREQADTGVDIGLWLDEIESSLGNPVLIEIKTGQLSEARLKQAEEQLHQNLTKTNGKVGLLVYFDRAGRRFPGPPSGWPLVVRFELSELAEALIDDKLVPILVAARNRAAHGR